MPLLVVLGSVRPSSAACPQLCPGAGDCIVSGSQTCTAPATLDLGGRALIIDTGATLRVTGGNGSLTITGAASVTLEANAKIIAVASDGGGSLAITSAGFVSLDSSSVIDASGSFGGSIEITAQSGDLEAGGSLKTNGTNEEGGNVTLIASAGNLTLGGLGINASASGDLNDGGEVTLRASGNIAMGAPIASRGHGGGFGGDVTVDNGTGMGDVDVNGQIDVGSAGEDAAGGTVAVSAGFDLNVEASILASAGNDGQGGDVTLAAVRNIMLTSTIDVGAGIAGSITVAPQDPLADPLAELIRVQGMLLANGTGADGQGGQILLQGCTLQLVSGSVVSSLGSGDFPNATNTLRASGQMSLSGTLSAGSSNQLEFRETQPSLGGTITPAAELSVNPDLPCCADDDSCTAPPPTTTTTSTVATTSTSTTTTSSTTPTTTGPTTSTTTSTAGPSTTLPATTSTSTTGAPVTTSSTTTAPAPTSTLVTTTLPPGASTSTSTPSTVPSTSTTASSPPTTSSTVPPVSCLEQLLGGFDAVDCRLGILSEALRSSSTDALGGAKSAHMLGAKIAKASQLIETARAKAKRKPILRRAKKQLQTFRNLAQRGVKRHRIEETLGARFVALSRDAMATIDQLRTAP